MPNIGELAEALDAVCAYLDDERFDFEAQGEPARHIWRSVMLLQAYRDYLAGPLVPQGMRRSMMTSLVDEAFEDATHANC